MVFFSSTIVTCLLTPSRRRDGSSFARSAADEEDRCLRYLYNKQVVYPRLQKDASKPFLFFLFYVFHHVL